MAAPAKTDEQRLLLKPREAAVRLSISERQLWAHSQPRGPIPATRIGNSVRYSPEALAAYIRQQSGDLGAGNNVDADASPSAT